MTLSQAKLVIPAHMLPGGVAPNANDFGFAHVEKQRLENRDIQPLTEYSFRSPLPHIDKANLATVFDNAAEHFLWHLAKGTPYQITKSFSNGSQTTKSYHYENNRLTSKSSPLADLLANSLF
ncbi:hypothetical protein BIZ37_29820 [Photobacterium sp. BZF1]|uniref:hypothetical protein n=1 Tax=Photobacterium sp. BZF1 TaxID=1904457 RepID=UPI001653D3EF|nr:hypothetical protein [Photobacterium sp. BZF1]MBC7006747.1 hypothetical protein [Photobacterium sp. BZF1]